MVNRQGGFAGVRELNHGGKRALGLELHEFPLIVRRKKERRFGMEIIAKTKLVAAHCEGDAQPLLPSQIRLDRGPGAEYHIS